MQQGIYFVPESIIFTLIERFVVLCNVGNLRITCVSRIGLELFFASQRMTKKNQDAQKNLLKTFSAMSILSHVVVRKLGHARVVQCLKCTTVNGCSSRLTTEFCFGFF